MAYGDGPTMHFTAFYGSPEQSNRCHSWTTLKRLRDVAPLLPWLVIGDFNEILSNANKQGGALRNEVQMDDFRKVLDFCSFSELPVIGDPFTWFKSPHKADTIKERLDWCFVNDKWTTTFEPLVTTHLDFFRSDHRAIAVTVQPLNQLPQQVRRKSRFRFEKLWLTDAEAAAIIKQNWCTSSTATAVESFLNNLESCSSSLQTWHTRKYGNMKQEITTMQQKISALNHSTNRSTESMEELKNSETILDDLLAQEETYWQQRSRVDWMQNGDQNTKFFHAHATSRRNNNSIKSLENAAGVIDYSKQGMTAIISDYFQELFTAQPLDSTALNHTINTIPQTVTAAMNDTLTQPFTPAEITAALKMMSPDKSPGSDGMSAMFYQNYWDIVGSSVTDVVLGILNNGNEMDMLNKSIITLIPKISTPTGMGDYRPISLCNVIYKLISKVLVLRFKEVLPFVISESQSAFLSNRLITDNILVAFELVHYLKHKTQGKKGYSALKLDMSKAFDRVEWAYLAAVMEKMGFASTWISLIMKCLSSTSFSFSLNGEIVGNVKPGRGLRQGDPLSPYLFLICFEGLSRLLNHEEDIGNLAGLRLTRHAPSISHLLFADDSLLFCHATNNSALAINIVLRTYHRASGQLLNTQKSVMSFSPNTDQAIQMFFNQTLNMPISDCHERYLGLPTYLGRDKKEMFSNIKERIWKLLNAWKEKLFSIGGKEVRLKAVVQSIPTYAMSCFKLPKTFCSQLESMMANFWWGSNKMVTKFIGRIEIFYASPNLKEHKYFSQSSFWDANLGHSPSLTWQGICWGRELFIKGLRYKIGNGYHVSAATDPWIPAISNFCPITYDGPPSMLVSYFITQAREWNISLLKAHFGDIDVDRILTIPLSFFPTQDRLIWHYTTTGIYTVKSGFHLASDLNDKEFDSASNSHQEWHAKDIWNQFHFPIDFAKARHLANGDYLFHLATLLSQEEFELLLCIMWVIWIDRNKIIHGDMNKDATAMALYAITYMNNYIKANSTKPPTATLSSPSAANPSHTATDANVAAMKARPTAGVPWTPPLLNKLKLNVDAAINTTDKILGIGAIVRNHDGQVVAALSKPVQGCFRSDEMEAKALFHALNWITQLSLKIDYVETDALRVSSAINNASFDLSSFSDIILDVRCLLSFFPGIVVSHVRRNANQAAHGLAKYALGLDVDTCWRGEIPSPIFSVVVNDG
uniref:Reverse transcriptase domain-containing protein n=1 Tax=Cannabis sativa TaxID=3483 RepID=A0A803NW04_CANSA